MLTNMTSLLLPTCVHFVHVCKERIKGITVSYFIVATHIAGTLNFSINIANDTV